MQQDVYDLSNNGEIPKGLVILGFGGHARSVADVALAMGITELYFVDDNAQPDESFLGFPVTTRWPDELEDKWSITPAIGDNGQRKEQMDKIQKAGLRVATIIAPTASIGAGSRIDQGSFIGHHAHVGPMARIGTGCIVNTCAVVDHESVVGEFTHVSLNSTIAGRCKIGCFAMLGAGATMIDGVNVADGVVIGAGGVVIESLTEAGVYVGVPVKRVST